jgi:hypothetical protein
MLPTNDLCVGAKLDDTCLEQLPGDTETLGTIELVGEEPTSE